jgi:hypothetical protein
MAVVMVVQTCHGSIRHLQKGGSVSHSIGDAAVGLRMSGFLWHTQTVVFQFHLLVFVQLKNKYIRANHVEMKNGKRRRNGQGIFFLDCADHGQTVCPATHP